VKNAVFPEYGILPSEEIIYVAYIPYFIIWIGFLLQVYMSVSANNFSTNWYIYMALSCNLMRLEAASST
jgi:hypothetical protein